MNAVSNCPECGAAWRDGQTCTDTFYQMGYWELDHQLWDVHHLMVACYHLQHPTLYSQEGLEGVMGLLKQWVDDGVTPQETRKRIKNAVASGARDYKIKGTPEAHGVYKHPLQWTMTAADVVAAGLDNYYASVRAWAKATLDVLRESGNLPTSPKAFGG